jgi:hypothetical protein
MRDEQIEMPHELEHQMSYLLKLPKYVLPFLYSP